MLRSEVSKKEELSLGDNWIPGPCLPKPYVLRLIPQLVDPAIGRSLEGRISDLINELFIAELRIEWTFGR